MLQTHDRFVNNELLKFITRPQYENSCSISSLTAVFNYLFSDKIGIKTTNELSLIASGKPAKDITGAGNQTVMNWFSKIIQHYGLKGNCSFYIRDKDVEDWDNNFNLISDMKQKIISKDHALVYHMQNHYNIVIGYFENSDNPDDTYNANAELQRWIILGEHSEYNPLPKLVQNALRLVPNEDMYNLVMESIGRTPIWTRRWKSIRHDLMASPNHCALMFNNIG